MILQEMTDWVFGMHGDIKQSSWTYKKAVGDHASLPQMKVHTIDDEDRLVVAWKEGSGVDSELITRIVDDTFSTIDNSSMEISARGLSQIVFTETSRIQVMHDMVVQEALKSTTGRLILRILGWQYQIEFLMAGYIQLVVHRTVVRQ